jgi:hypothetical protein
MASDRTRRTVAKMAVSRPSPRVLELRSDGYVTRFDLVAALGEAEQLLTEHPDIDAMLWNTLHHDGHEPGNTNLGVAFHRQHTGRFQRAVILTHSAPMAALSNVARALLPSLTVAVFAQREDAIAWLTRGHSQHGGRRTRAA